MSKEEGIHSYKEDSELIQYMLEKAEIDFEVQLVDTITSFTLDNGVSILFDSNGELCGIDNE